jgi:acid phosphatase
MAKAYDAAGNAATASVTVTVSNTGGGAGLTPSGPITVSGQSGVVVQGLHITNPSGDCVTITNSTNITIRQSEIGPCSGNGIVINNGNTINIFDNYIHPEGTLAGCCDVTDGIFANGTQSLTVQGNVIAYGEANIEAQNQTNITIIGNFFLNPRNSGSRGQNIQVFYGSSNALVENNYTLASVDTTLYKFAESQEDSINFGASATGNLTNGIIARNNYMTGGHSAFGCGLIADTGVNRAQLLSNTLVDTGQCGIGIADGTNHVVDSNKVLNSAPVSGGGNNAIYVWKVNSSDPPCGPVQISNNIASAIASDGSANSFWNGGGCEPVTTTNNTFDAAAQQELSPATVKLPPPPIPPQPNTCVIASPFTNNTALPACGGSGSGGGGGGSTAPTVAIISPASGATVSGTITVSTNASANTTSVQFNVDGTSAGSAVTSAPFSFSLNTTTLSKGSHSLAAVASSAGGQTTTSAAVSINVNNPHLQITTSALPRDQVQVSYSATLQATGGTPPYTWSVLSGQLPTGLSLSPGGTISGTPTLAGSFALSIGVNDSAGLSTSSAFSINIATPPPSPTAPFGHVIVVVEENANFSDVIGNSSTPYVNSLANQYGLATQYYADTHPSIGNYLVMTTGQILTNDDSQTPLSFPVSVDNAARELLAAGKTWKAYAESIPSVGYVGGDATGPDGGQFYTRHAPLPYMTDVQNSAVQRQNVVPFTQFKVDLASNALPNYSFITPNGCNDAHDCGLDVADNWLKTNIDPLIKSALFQTDGLLIIVFDESNTDNTNGGGQVPAIVISPFAKVGFKSTQLYQHESLLRLTLEGLGVTTLPAPAASAPVMWEFFTFTPPT